jgi:hypothetical protein
MLASKLTIHTSTALSASYSLSTIRYSLSTIHYPLFTIHYSLSTKLCLELFFVQWVRVARPVDRSSQIPLLL